MGPDSEILMEKNSWNNRQSLKNKITRKTISCGEGKIQTLLLSILFPLAPTTKNNVNT